MSAVAQLCSLGHMAFFEMFTFFTKTVRVADVFFTDGGDVVFVAPVFRIAFASFWPWNRHEGVVFAFRFAAF